MNFYFMLLTTKYNIAMPCFFLLNTANHLLVEYNVKREGITSVDLRWMDSNAEIPRSNPAFDPS